MADNTQNRSAMLQSLGEPFPRSAVKQKPGGGGKRLDYVEGHTVIHRLNTSTPGWDWIIKGMEWRADMLVVWGELTIPGLGTRSGVGISENMRGDVVKGASTDALKKAATLFGVALELYGPDYESDAATAPVARQEGIYGKPPPRRPNQEPDEEEDGPALISTMEAERIKAKCDARGLSDDDRTALLEGKFGVGKIFHLDEAQGAVMMHLLESETDEGLVTAIDYYLDLIPA